LGAERPNDSKDHDTDQKLDDCEAAADAAMVIVCHVQLVQSTLVVAAFVRRKFTVSGLNFAFVGVMTMFTDFILLVTGSVTVTTRVCG
jgi:hypothetical protein